MANDIGDVNAQGRKPIESSREGGNPGTGMLGQTRPTGVMATGKKRKDLDTRSMGSRSGSGR